jgi:Zn-dependent peptidase ImmA (M78 family)
LQQRQRERECDIFAAHVLMPEEWVLNLEGPLWVAARRLGVSQQALSVRLDELGISRG